ncbi:MAG: AAA family ATPase, partial [Oscillospiraceae bacterium]|nr:AAA family ATPase [Oscillospiraceae bacterium]
RRFGKTLNLSMIQRFFEKTEESNAYLFENLKISREGEEYLKHQGKYPVITLSLKALKQPDYDKSIDFFKFIVQAEYKRHRKILESNKISDEDREKYKRILSGKANESEYGFSLKFLSDCLSEVYEKNVIILIDEYDVPLENAYFCGFYDKMVSFIRSVFESVLKTNPSLEFAILTGCLRISKESIFTGLNNLKVYSITENIFSQYFGFTQEEVEELAVSYDLADRLPEMKEWYDGYRFGKTEIYNPWSIIQYISSATGGNEISCKPYWINTSSNSIVHQLVSQSNQQTRNKIETLIAGGSVSAEINENTVYADINVNSEDIWSFLLFTGYLKQIKSEFTGRKTISEMVIPNVEVMTVYENTIMRWFEDIVLKESTSELLNCFVSENVEGVQSEINRWLRKSISFHDARENFYHGFLLGLLSGDDKYDVKSNRENGDGRTDITICEYQTRKIAVVIEIKTAERFGELEKRCEDGLRQIEENRYAEQLKDDWYEKVITYSVSFNGKTCKVKQGDTLTRN